MARPVRTDFSGPAKRADPVIHGCAWTNEETGEWCPNQGTHGQGPPRWQTEQWFCGWHVPADFYEGRDRDEATRERGVGTSQPSGAGRAGAPPPGARPARP